MRVLPGSTVLGAQRNEGPFLLEWIAWYLALGFEHVLIMHNDCTDHSPQLLRLLERLGVITQQKVVTDPALPPQPQAHRKAARHHLIREADWAFTCDMDEFLVVHVGDGTVAALAEEVERVGACAMALHWRIFGTMGQEAWEDQLVHRRYTMAAPREVNQNTGLKTFTRWPGQWEFLRAHGPKNWGGPRAGDPPGTWGTPPYRIALGDGSALDDYAPEGTALNHTDIARVRHDMAQVNHYALQSVEKFSLKRGVPGAGLNETRYTDGFFRNFDWNEVEDRSALRFSDRFDAVYRRITDIPGVLRLHHLCCADFLTTVAEKAGHNPAEDPRIAHHRNTARQLPAPLRPAQAG
ncbi:glycosyltransferase family 2 protein [Maritimibacter sp. DP1N21-5]|uniref:glycosyltransferase family 2 protein n=1 Tax=Maritimibacter sp. DP1N21-5 TaxID=2836867 RepID=UPI001C49456C|nr:glycosyltransferase family 2 protein [Maritimibacter sp. DP1N21-5]MBV7408098.1 glycosyltransferase family 2 protein [Maritimibacter sp. DP1N21-5]